METIVVWYRSGGPFIAPLVIVGVLGLVVLGERINHIVLQSRIHARPFMEKVISLARAGKLDEALQLCADHHSAIPDLGLVILRSRTEAEADLLQVAEAATLTVIPGLTRRVAWLLTLAIVAGLLGVLGGVANLHDAMMQAARAGTGSAAPLAEGIAYALRPFGVGVLTAVPLVAGHAYLAGEAQKLIGQLEEFSARLVNALIDRPDVRLGHRT